MQYRPRNSLYSIVLFIFTITNMYVCDCQKKNMSFNIEWESCGGEADQVRVDDILVDPPFGQGESTVEFEGKAFTTPPVPGSAEVRLFFFGLPFATEEIVVCPPEEDCPYIEGPMRVLFDLDLSILPSGNYGIEYDSVDAVGAPLFCVKFDFTM
jgi:hypothetical protein